MQPNDGFFASVCWIIAIASIVGAVALGPRIAGRNLRMGAARLGTHLVTAITVMIAMLVTLNVQYSWYGDWTDLSSDLFGSKQAIEKTGVAGAASVKHDVAKDKAADKRASVKFSSERARFEASLHLKQDPGPGGQYAFIWVGGAGKGEHGNDGLVMLWFPQSYTNPANKDRTYPVIEAFHGIPGGTRDYHTVYYQAHKLFAPAMNNHQLADSILLVPDLSPKGVDTECVDGGGIPEETWITKTVPDFVISHLRVKSEASAWATLGFSAGGWCSAMASILHPDRYGAGIILGGYFSPQFSNWWPFPKGQVPAKYNLLSETAKNPPKTQIWIEVSGKDAISGPSSAQFVKEAKPPTSVTSVTLPHAGHRMQVWGDVIPDALAWLGKTLPAFSPRAD